MCETQNTTFQDCGGRDYCQIITAVIHCACLWIIDGSGGVFALELSFQIEKIMKHICCITIALQEDLDNSSNQNISLKKVFWKLLKFAKS